MSFPEKLAGKNMNQTLVYFFRQIFDSFRFALVAVFLLLLKEPLDLLHACESNLVE